MRTDRIRIYWQMQARLNQTYHFSVILFLLFHLFFAYFSSFSFRPSRYSARHTGHEERTTNTRTARCLPLFVHHVLDEYFKCAKDLCKVPCDYVYMNKFISYTKTARTKQIISSSEMHSCYYGPLN